MGDFVVNEIVTVIRELDDTPAGTVARVIDVYIGEGQVEIQLINNRGGLGDMGYSSWQNGRKKVVNIDDIAKSTLEEILTIILLKITNLGRSVGSETGHLVPERQDIPIVQAQAADGGGKSKKKKKKSKKKKKKSKKK